MKVAELIELVRCMLIAYDSRTGEILFNTATDKQEKIAKFSKGKVTFITANPEVYRRYILQRHEHQNSTDVVTCQVFHNSWIDSEVE